MSYQIRYSDASMIKEVRSYRKPITRWLFIVGLVLLLSGLLQLDAVQNFLIPGDPEVTKAAFSSFTQELRAGERFSDAAAVFCRQVIESDVIE